MAGEGLFMVTNRNPQVVVHGTSALAVLAMSRTRGLGQPQIGVDIGQQVWVVLPILDASLLQFNASEVNIFS